MAAQLIQATVPSGRRTEPEYFDKTAVFTQGSLIPPLWTHRIQLDLCCLQRLPHIILETNIHESNLQLSASRTALSKLRALSAGTASKGF